MTIKTISTLPPQILQSFDSLLKAPVPKLFDDCEYLWKIYQYILQKLKKKCKDEIRINKFNKMEKQFLELYVRAKTKEKELEEKTGRANKGFFYYISTSNRIHPKIHKRLRTKTYMFKSSGWEDYDISKI